MQVEREPELAPEESGERESNTWITYPLVGNNNLKRLLIPHNTILMPVRIVKAGDFFGNLALKEGFTAY